MSFNHISLFSGQGGNDLASEWMGWDNINHCEKNEFCLKILKYYWPNAITHKDIKTTDFTIYRGTIDIVTCGFSCQPFSTAGKQLGTEDERSLWPEGFRAIREIKPSFVVPENVPGLISWGNGVVFDQVQADLESEGFEVIPFVLPAAGIEAPHARHRIWFIAYSHSNDARRREYGQIRQKTCKVQTFEEEWQRIWTFIKRVCPKETITHTEKTKRKYCSCTWSGWYGATGVGNVRFITKSDSVRQKGSWRPKRQECSEKTSNWKTNWSFDDSRWPTVSPVCSGDDGLSARLDAITFSSWRNQSIMSAGNSVVPQLVFEIFKAIEAFNNTLF